MNLTDLNLMYQNAELEAKLENDSSQTQAYILLGLIQQTIPHRLKSQVIIQSLLD